MLTFDSLVGNAELKKSLRRALAARFPQTILLTGPAGIGKLTLARILAAALLCPAEPAPCGQCGSCRRIEQEIHPDVTLIDQADAEIKIETARFLRSECAVLPGEAERRVFLIRHAQNMNVPAQNALLKILEEPPSYAFFILMTENAGAILPTILSRCTQYALSPLSGQEMPDLLKRLYPDTPAETLRSVCDAAQGIAGNAADLLSGEVGEAAAAAAPILKALASRNELVILQAASECNALNRKQFSHVLAALSSGIRDAVFTALGLPGVMLPAVREESAALASGAAVHQLLELYDWVQELQLRVERNQSMPLLTGCLAARSYELLQS